MKFFILIPFLLIFSYASEFVPLAVVNKVEKQYDRFAKNRFLALNKMLKKLEKADTKRKLEKVNDFFNSVKYVEDIDIYGVSDYWATPFEFLAHDKGDCEDFVIAKYFALTHLGIPTNKLFFSYVKAEGRRDTHMVLSYFETPNSEPLVLDNIRRIIFPSSKRDDLKFIYNFNPYILEDGKKTKAHKNWEELILRVNKNKI